MINLRQTRQSAFTLIEALVVVVLITIVVAIAIPALNSSKEDSIRTNANANAKALNEARQRAVLTDDPNAIDTNSFLYWSSTEDDKTNLLNAAAYLIEKGYLQAN